MLSAIFALRDMRCSAGCVISTALAVAVVRAVTDRSFELGVKVPLPVVAEELAERRPCEKHQDGTAQEPGV